MPQFAAFLRGINSGKNPTMVMQDLRKVFEDLDLQNVQTVIASGNVIFDIGFVDKFTVKGLENQIEQAIYENFKFKSMAIIKNHNQLVALVQRNPFKNVTLDKNRRANVTFVQDVDLLKDFDLQRGVGFEIVDIFEGCISSVIDLSQAKSPDLMAVLDKRCGKAITTRTWGSVQKIFDKM